MPAFEARNFKPAFLWGFAAVFLTFLSAMSVAIWCADSTAGNALWVNSSAMLFFWSGGIALARYVCSIPCVTVSIDDTNILSVVLRYPFGFKRYRFREGEVSPAKVAREVDDEGNAYYFTRLVTPAGETVNVAESHDESHCRLLCDQFNLSFCCKQAQP